VSLYEKPYQIFKGINSNYPRSPSLRFTFSGLEVTFSPKEIAAFPLRKLLSKHLLWVYIEVSVERRAKEALLKFPTYFLF
jgi:hypothetical protein